MKIRYHKAFQKHIKKLPQKIQLKTSHVIKDFMKNPHDKRLYNHPLGGDFLGLRSISVTGDIRIIFEERDNYKCVEFLDIGSHSQLYK